MQKTLKEEEEEEEELQPEKKARRRREQEGEENSSVPAKQTEKNSENSENLDTYLDLFKNVSVVYSMANQTLLNI